MLKNNAPDPLESSDKKRCKQQRQWLASRQGKGIFSISIGALWILLIVLNGEALPSRVLRNLEFFFGDSIKNGSHVIFEIFIGIFFIVNGILLLLSDDKKASR